MKIRELKTGETYKQEVLIYFFGEQKVKNMIETGYMYEKQKGEFEILGY